MQSEKTRNKFHFSVCLGPFSPIFGRFLIVDPEISIMQL